MKKRKTIQQIFLPPNTPKKTYNSEIKLRNGRNIKKTWLKILYVHNVIPR